MWNRFEELDLETLSERLMWNLHLGTLVEPYVEEVPAEHVQQG